MFISLFIGVFALFILYAWHLKRPGKRTSQNVVYAWISWMILLGLTIPMCRGMLRFAAQFMGAFTPRRNFFITSISTILIVLIGILFVLIARKSVFKRMSMKTFVFLAIIVGICLKLVYVLLMDVKLVSDFESMWKIVTNTITSGWPDKIIHVHQERVLLFYVPLASC